MIGNDVVDLTKVKGVDERRSQKRIEKTLTPSEVDQLPAFRDTNLIYWIFWSLKESAYKLFYKHRGQRKFIPKKFSSVLHASDPGMFTARISSPVGQLFGKVRFSGEYLHAIVASTLQELDNVQAGVFPVSASCYDVQSREVRQALLTAISTLSQYPVQQLGICQDAFIPKVFFKNKALPIDVSMSHHHYWGAWAFLQASD